MDSGRDADFVQFLESMVNLDALDRMTMELGNELKDSQVVMNEIKGIIDALPVKVDNVDPGIPKDEVPNRDIITNILSTGTSNILMPDMVSMVDLDLEDVIAQMKSYTEDLKKTIIQPDQGTQPTFSPRQVEGLELEHYASSLDQFSKKISNVKLVKKPEENQRNPELENKLTILCDDVNKFTKMVHAKTTLNETAMNWSPTQQSHQSLEYDNLINKLLSGINEVTYLLTSKN